MAAQLNIDMNDLVETLTAQRNEAEHKCALTDAALKGALRENARLAAEVQAMKDAEAARAKRPARKAKTTTADSKAA